MDTNQTKNDRAQAENLSLHHKSSELVFRVFILSGKDPTSFTEKPLSVHAETQLTLQTPLAHTDRKRVDTICVSSSSEKKLFLLP
jgi:hypothetical protein